MSQTIENDYRKSTIVDVESVSNRIRLEFFSHRPTYRIKFEIEFIGVGNSNSIFVDLQNALSASSERLTCRSLKVSSSADQPRILAVELALSDKLCKFKCHSFIESVFEKVKVPYAERACCLTSPHLCHQCESELVSEDEPILIGKPKTTIACPSCSHLTSVYATFHLCVGCNGLLESPSINNEERSYHCPRCSCEGQVPADLLLEWNQVNCEPVGDEAGEFFAVNCVACTKQWATDSTNVGRLTVCRKCCSTQEIPIFGKHLEIAKSFSDPMRRCNGCGSAVPVRASCPFCQNAIS